MEDKKLNEKESLELITSMIARTKERYLGSGNILIMWGCLIVIISVFVWIFLAVTGKPAWNWLWFGIPVIGFPVTVAMRRREGRKYNVVTYSDKITAQIWSVFAISVVLISLICLGFALFAGIQCWVAIMIYTLIAAPFAEIAQGIIVKERSLVWGGITGLAVGMITVCCVSARIPLEVKWFMPLFILVWVAMMIVPGYVLNYKAKRQ